MFRRHPIRRLLGDTELTPRLAQVLTQVAHERNEPSFIAMLCQMNALALKSLRDELPGRIAAYEAQIAERQRELAGYVPPPYVRPCGRLAYSPSGAIIDLDTNEQDAAYEGDRARSLDARAENERIEREHDAAERAAYEQAAAEAFERELPHTFREP